MSNSQLPIVDQALACCAPLAREAMGDAEARQVAPLLKALADPVRLRLMSLVLSHAGGEACVCDLTPQFDLSQPTVSHHLKALHDAGIITREQRGKWAYLALDRAALNTLSRVLAA